MLQAVESLEQVYFQSHFGYRWIEARALLADVYRRVGRVDDARAIEHDLLALLVIADEDFALLRKLRGPSTTSRVGPTNIRVCVPGWVSPLCTRRRASRP